ncbi:MAG: Xaa-Pro peptidase family protein [Pseudomonadota bacterium]
MALHFTADEFSARENTLQTELDSQGLDGILIFAQESSYWLTGYDTFGYCFFQCLYFGTDGRKALLTRSADLRQAQHTSTIEDIRVWKDGIDADPAGDLRTMLENLGCQGKKLGIEFDTVGLTAANGRRIEATLDGFCTLSDASLLITRLRAIKSDAELAYVRKAGELSDAALEAARQATRAGADEGDILAAQHNAIFRAGGDYPGNEFIIGSGNDALLCRYKSGRRVLDDNDQLTLEWAGAYRHYHAAQMRTIVVGTPTDRHRRYHDAAREALLACEDCFRPGHVAGDVFAAHARVLDGHGLTEHRLNACGYSLGAVFTPCWMDMPMFYEGNNWEIVPGMVLFAHMILMDSESGTAMCLGRSSIVTESDPETLSAASLDLMVE